MTQKNGIVLATEVVRTMEHFIEERISAQL